MKLKVRLRQFLKFRMPMIREAGADQAVLTLKSLEAFTKAADGRATKIIIPSEIQGLAGLATSLKEFVTDDKKELLEKIVPDQE